jgi:hypothetical protein
MKRIRQQTGMGILQVIVISSVFFGVVLLLSRLLDKQTSLSDNRAKSASKDLFIKTLAIQLNDPFICSMALTGEKLKQKLGEKQKLNRIQLSYGGTAGPITGDWNSPEVGAKVGKIQFTLELRALLPKSTPAEVPKPRTISYDWPNLPNPTPNQYQKFYGFLEVHFQDDRWNPLALGRPIPLTVILDPTTNKIHQCHGQKSIAEACESLGGSYDVSNRSREELRCNPDLICFNHKSGLVKNKADCVAPYMAMEVGRIDGEQMFMCNWCNRNR